MKLIIFKKYGKKVALEQKNFALVPELDAITWDMKFSKQIFNQLDLLNAVIYAMNNDFYTFGSWQHTIVFTEAGGCNSWNINNYQVLLNVKSNYFENAFQLSFL